MAWLSKSHGKVSKQKTKCFIVIDSWSGLKSCGVRALPSDKLSDRGLLSDSLPQLPPDARGQQPGDSGHVPWNICNCVNIYRLC